MEEFNFYRDNYLLEFEVKERLEKSASNSITILVILGSIVSLFVNEIKNTDYSFLSIIFISLLSISATSFLASLYFIIKALYNYVYMYAPTSSELKKYHSELLTYHSNETNASVLAKNDLEAYIIGEYAANAHTNFQRNGQKSAFIHLTNTYIIVTIILLLLTAVPYFVKTFKNDNHQKVEIINHNETKENCMSQETSKPTTTPKPTTTVPNPKPTPPPSTGRRDGNVPKQTPPPSKNK